MGRASSWSRRANESSGSSWTKRWNCKRPVFDSSSRTLEEMMKKPRLLLWMMGLLFAPALSVHGQDKPPLKLIQKIPLPNVKGRIDHMDVDVRGKRLFVAGLENGTLEVVDLKAGKWARSVPGLQTPQGVAYVPALNKVFVANENDDTLKV